jgi:hypothetical protein
MRPLSWLLLFPAFLGTSAAQGQTPAGIEFFEKKIRPVLVEHCYRCHSASTKGPSAIRSGLRLDTRDGIRKGGGAGPAVVPGKPGDSLLLAALRHEELKMPPNGKLPDAVIADFEAWVKMGAPDPRDAKTVPPVAGIDWDKARQFWAFQPPRKHPAPPMKDAAWPRKEIDPFILADLEKRGLKPARPASKREWLRRATFDLIGLPPTPEEIAAFENDSAPDAFAKVVDRLLQSPHYGERWGRYWLDLARYTDDLGGTVGPVLAPNAYRYRDWVVDAFQRDMPYDQFIRLQLAGDLIAEPAANHVERLAGLGFQGLGQQYSGNAVGMVKKKVADELDDRVDTVTRSLLGLTVSCARCHDHKFDPIPTIDYYALAAAYNGADWSQERILDSPEKIAAADQWKKNVADRKAKLDQLTQAEAKRAGRKLTPQEAVALMAESLRKQHDELQAELDRLNAAAPPTPLKAPSVFGGGKAMQVNLRGNPDQLGETAPPGFLQILKPANAAKSAGFSRLDLAHAIASRDNPLTARVFVNRVWHYHFGRGIVGTPSNFGHLGNRPTHPELLDTLAVRFMEAGWSTHWLHREIMLSATYQLGSDSDPANAARDADNLFLWRTSPRRLDFEAWRDAMLAVAGKLDPKVGGPPYLDPAGKSQLHSEDPANRRRTLYSFISRFKPNPTLTLFDFPEPNVTSDQRTVTTIPQQQLFALNSPFIITTARAFAARVEKAEPNEDARLRLAWRLAFGRLPTERETALSSEFLRAANPRNDEKLTPWEQLCHSLLTTNEFAFVN